MAAPAKPPRKFKGNDQKTVFSYSDDGEEEESTSLPRSRSGSSEPDLKLASENETLKSTIISLKKQLSYHKNESLDFTENMTRQNEMFLRGPLKF